MLYVMLHLCTNACIHTYIYTHKTYIHTCTDTYIHTMHINSCRFSESADRRHTVRKEEGKFVGIEDLDIMGRMVCEMSCPFIVRHVHSLHVMCIHYTLFPFIVCHVHSLYVMCIHCMSCPFIIRHVHSLYVMCIHCMSCPFIIRHVH